MFAHLLACVSGSGSAEQVETRWQDAPSFYRIPTLEPEASLDTSGNESRPGHWYSMRVAGRTLEPCSVQGGSLAVGHRGPRCNAQSSLIKMKVPRV